MLKISPKKPTRRQLLVIGATILVIVAGGLVWFAKRPHQSDSQTNGGPGQPNQQKIDDQTVRLIATGDFVPHDSVNANAKSGDDYSYLPMMQNLKPFFDKSDVRFCNQATLAAGTSFRVSGYPLFNAPTEWSRDMAALGCNVINTASNHSFDKGQSAIKASLDYWDGLSGILAVAGTNRSAEEQAKIRYFEVKGVKFAFLAYTTYNNTPPQTPYGLNQFSRDFAGKQLAEARGNSDVIIVSIRWGTEYSSKLTANQDDIAQFLADSGADVVLGHGPHVLAPVKLIKGAGSGGSAVVWYSLGNFLNTQVPVETLFGCIAVMDININDKTINNVACLPFYMHYEWTAEQKKAEDLLKRHDLAMYTLDTAAEPLARSQNNTTVEAQRQRISDLLNKFMSVKILRDSEY